MCGICGFYGENDNSLLKRMTEALAHRGPNQTGYFTDKNISLGHKRLSIIDLSAKGKQPMHNEDGTITIVFNGEIYNHKEIKSSLREKHNYTSQTDTESIIHCYEERGEGVLDMLEGDFAFAIWDSRKKKLLLARDRLGVKPLYYCWNDKKFYFASEIKSLLQNSQIKRELDKEAMNQFLSFRYIPGEKTIFKGINKLQPGHSITLHNGISKTRKYWDLTFSEENYSLNYCADMLDKLMKEAIEKQLMSDVPLGAFIGGGIDSSTIIAYMMHKMDRQIKTFTVGFEHEKDSFNEYKPANAISKAFNTDHQEITVGPESVKLLPEVIWHLDEPMADPSAITSYILAREAKKKVTVVLSGEGGDEIFGGYEQYRMMQKADSINRTIPKYLQTALIESSRLLPDESFFHKLRMFISSIENKPKAYTELITVFDLHERKMLYTNNTQASIKNIDSDFKTVSNYFNNNFSLVNKMLLHDTKTALPENLLMNTDKLGMAHSLEGRVPLLDHKLVEFCATIPTKMKIRGNNEKYILKYAMRKMLPKEAANRKKRRFHVPTDTWFSLYLKDFARDLLTSSEFRRKGIFNPKYIEKLLNYQNTISYNLILKRNMLTKLYYSRQLWSILCLAIWDKTFIDSWTGKKPKPI